MGANEHLPVLLIPGLGGSPRLYQAQVPALWSRGCAVMVANHTRGETIAAIASAILEAAPPRFSLGGLSMGGYLALEIMRQAPQRVARLALMDTSARPESPQATPSRRERIALAEAGRFDEVADIAWPSLVHASRLDDAPLKATYRAQHADVGAAAYVRQQHAIIARPDSRPSLAAIGCPTLVLVGDADELTPPDAAREIAAGIAGAQLVVVPQCGHLSTLERPQAVNEALLAWLAR